MNSLCNENELIFFIESQIIESTGIGNIIKEKNALKAHYKLPEREARIEKWCSRNKLRKHWKSQQMWRYKDAL